MAAVDSVSGLPTSGNPARATGKLSPERRQRVGYLDGIRGLAIGAVLIVHWVGSQLPFGRGGYIGVDLFFVLSGYIITTMLWRSRPRGRSVVAQYRTFLRHRLVRLYPALVAMVFGTILVSALLPDARARVADLLAPGLVALIQGTTFAAARGNWSPFEFTWSLSTEWMFYLVWPLAIYVARQAGVGAQQAAKVVSFVAGAIYLGAMFQTPNWFYFGPLARIPEMLIGGALALSVVEVKCYPSLRRPRVAMCIALILVAFSAAYTAFGPGVHAVIYRFFGLPLAVGTGLCLIWLGLRVDNGVVRWLSCRPLTLLGRASYSVYLWNLIGLNLFVPPNSNGGPVVVLAAIAFGLGMSATSYFFIELPLVKSKMSATVPATPRSE